MNEIPEEWVTKITDDEWRDTAARLTSLALHIPSIKSRVLELIWLICIEDARRSGNGQNTT